MIVNLFTLAKLQPGRRVFVRAAELPQIGNIGEPFSLDGKLYGIAGRGWHLDKDGDATADLILATPAEMQSLMGAGQMFRPN